MVGIVYGWTGENNMENSWEFKINLNKFDFGNIESKVGIKFSDNFKSFIRNANGASPKQKIVTISEKKYVLNDILDFNTSSEYTTEDIYNNLQDIIGNYYPFARDGFGNYYLINTKDNMVEFYDHECCKVISLCSFDEFILCLGVSVG